jgi:hypothetical protein
MIGRARASKPAADLLASDDRPAHLRALDHPGEHPHAAGAGR